MAPGFQSLAVLKVLIHLNSYDSLIYFYDIELICYKQIEYHNESYKGKVRLLYLYLYDIDANLFILQILSWKYSQVFSNVKFANKFSISKHSMNIFKE